MKILSRLIDPINVQQANRLICWIILMSLCLSPLIAQDIPTVAIMQFEASGMSENDAANITSRFGYELSKANRFRITEREMMEQILKEQQFQLSGCTSSECVVEVGQLLSVKYMIAGKVQKTIDFYSLHIRLISVESGVVITQVIEDYEGSAKDFVTVAVRNAAMKLAAESGTIKTSLSGQVVTNIAQTGQVTFSLNVTPVNVFIDGSFSGENTTDIVSLSLPSGNHTIKLTSQGYVDYEKTITILPDESINYKVELKKGVSESANTVTTGIIVVRSVPEGSTVFIDGRDAGKTPVQIPKAGSGRHTIRASKALYHDYLEEITVEPDGIIQVQASLIEAFGTLSIQSQPDSAVVTLNGQIKGRTPFMINELASGEYDIGISKDLYHPFQEKFIITDGSQNTRDIKLQPAFGQLVIKGAPEGSEVYLDGQLRGNSPLNLDELPSGNYTLRIIKDLYETAESVITIEDGKTYSHNYILQPRFGTLNIAGSPRGAKVMINGEMAGGIPVYNYKVTAGLVEIQTEMPDFHPDKRFQQVVVGDLVNLEINLNRHTGSVVVLTNPPGADVCLNLQDYGKSPQIIKDVPTGSQDLHITHPDFLTVDRIFDLELNERKEINIPLLTYSGSIQQDIDKVKLKRNINIASAVLLGITAGVMKIMSIKAYQDYENATVTADALDFYDKSNSLNKLSGYIGIAAGLSAAPIIKWQLDIGKLQGILYGVR